jgi:predicted nucleic acid-binding Zn ribbon protein
MKRKDDRSGVPKLRPIAEALSEMMHARGLDEEVARVWVLEAWGRLVGTQIAGVTQPRMVADDGTLVVGVTTHGWMQELSLMERSLVARINESGAGVPIKKIRWELLR